MEVRNEIGKQHEDFRHLSDQDLKKIQDLSVYHAYKKGQVLFNFDDERTHVFFLVSGVIKLERTDPTGTFNYLHFKKEKCLIPYLNLFTDNKYYLSAVAHTDIEVISIPVKIFEEIVSHNNQQLITTLQKQSTEMKMMITKIQKGIMNDADSRVTTTLALIYDDLGEKQYPSGDVVVKCPMTINDIARASGTSRETTSTTIRKLVQAKKINYTRKYLTFLDRTFFNNILNN